MNKKKILQLVSSSGFFGAENVIIELAKELLSTNFEPIIGVFNNTHSPHTEIVEEAKKYNLKVKIFTCNGQFDIRSVKAVGNFIKRNNIDIIHSHGYKSNFYALIANLFRNVSLITTCHLWTGGGFKNRIYESLDKLWIKRFDKIVTVSDELRTEVLNWGVSPSKVSTIDNGIDLNRFKGSFDTNNIRKKLNIASHFKVIGTIGRLDEQKGHIFLIESTIQFLKVFPDTIFLIVGDGSLKQKLQDKVVELSLENNFVFTGIRKDIPEILVAIDIFVLPSLSEGLPMVLLEAMAAKKPIIASGVGAIPKVIINNETGILIKPRDVDELTKSMIDLLRNKDKADLIAKNAYNKIVREFSSKKMVKEYIKIYDHILKCKNLKRKSLIVH